MSAFSCVLKNLQKVSGKRQDYSIPWSNTLTVFFLDNQFIMISKVALGAAAALMAGVVRF